MSVMRCECDRYIDTDFDCEGVWEHNGTRFWCADCVNEAIDSGETAGTNACLASLQKQDPTEYAELIAMRDEPAEHLPLAPYGASTDLLPSGVAKGRE